MPLKFNNLTNKKQINLQGNLNSGWFTALTMLTYKQDDKE